MSEKYNGIIDLPHHVSKKHRQMPISDRAAQFAPFAALSGYGDAVAEESRFAGDEMVYDETVLELLNEKMNLLKANLSDRPTVKITYFEPDGKKPGGVYRTVTSAVKAVDEISRTLITDTGAVIELDRITGIDGEIFDGIAEQ